MHTSFKGLSAFISYCYYFTFSVLEFLEYVVCFLKKICFEGVVYLYHPNFAINVVV